MTLSLLTDRRVRRHHVRLGRRVRGDERGGGPVHHGVGQVAEDLLGAVARRRKGEEVRVLVDEGGVGLGREEHRVLDHVHQEGDVRLEKRRKVLTKKSILDFHVVAFHLDASDPELGQSPLHLDDGVLQGVGLGNDLKTTNGERRGIKCVALSLMGEQFLP